MPATDLPPCGLYKTTGPIGDIAAGRLVYFHNHGDPGPGVYLPHRWVLNRVEFEPSGFTLPEPVAEAVALLDPLPDEGFYRITESFFCCEKECRSFDTELLVQLGYNAQGEGILFVPELTPTGIFLPDTGSAIGPESYEKLALLKMAESDEDDEPLPNETKPKRRKPMLH